MVSKTEMKELLKGTRWKIKEFIDSDDSQYIAIIKKLRQTSTLRATSQN